MAQPRRYDGYGQPLPELTDARREVLRETNFNQQQRGELFRRLEEQFDTLLRRGIWADVLIQFRVENGRIQPDLRVGVTRLYRSVQEHEDAPS